MLGILIILIFTVYLAFFFKDKKPEKKKEKVDEKIDTQMKKLWTIAQDSMREKKPVRAEKALLTILKFDEKNAAAYNRLGILYAKGQKFDEAIECFEIAQSLDNNPSSLHNAGLIYLETGAYEKAAMAFRQALEMEGDVPARFLALAKAEEKLGNRKAAIEALEAAYDLDHTTTTLRQILAIYESTGDTENATATIARIEAQIAENEVARKKKLAAKRPLGRPRPVVKSRPAVKSAKPAKTTKPRLARPRPFSKPRKKSL